ncbi:hypothetical protein W97_08310 [Coniosporium apollinis CBS 100218]|uniref:Uncharacterized protein n=1 Tax=Coniosporium apollinis (strain CBS 100218) TaxID=1168221 RepID=R7Z554_CONA1|nr:uncharacterized protein W97_08310 [Coniosporium apollinis CBS 100218]EON69124.1 hypothetical protein W97_08310 [Coniosporium apollinis CBS 100218]
MSSGAGGLAQMTYNNNNNFAPSGLGVPGAGFASRGKGAQLKRLSVAAPPSIAPISEHHAEGVSTPRTSRSHLLAGLRTQPKAQQPPASAPYNQTQHNFGLESSKYAPQNGMTYGRGIPQTAVGSNFPTALQAQYGMDTSQQLYSLPEQVLAPPSMQYGAQDDPNLAAQLLATELYLQQRQQQLQQQLLNLTAQQFGGMSLNTPTAYRQSQQFPATPMTPQTGMYNQHSQNGFSIPQQVVGQPGVYLVYNQMTGQYNYVTDTTLQQSQFADSPPPPTPSYAASPPKIDTPTFRAQVSPPNDNVSNPFLRGSSPPKKAPSPPQDVTPLPPPSANAFRPGHKKASSLAFKSNSNIQISDGPRSSISRPGGIPPTPQTGTFGPGQARAGEHPVRQPRGPPPMEELVAAPTTKHEGSKNFATRQRRRAVHSLVRAGIERRGARTGSGGSMTPVSDNEFQFSLPSDNDSDSARSGGSLSGKPSIGSLRAAASGAIGSERKASRERNSGDNWTANSVSSDEGASVGGRLLEVRPEENKPLPSERRTMPRFIINSAEKRKSGMF